MKIEELDQYNNDISDLKRIDEYLYENIFKVYRADDKYAFNILKTVNIDGDLDPRLFDLVRVAGKQSWPQISFKIYGSINLWWLICCANKIMNPVVNPKPGLVIRVVKPRYVETVLTQIKLQL